MTSLGITRLLIGDQPSSCDLTQQTRKGVFSSLPQCNRGSQERAQQKEQRSTMQRFFSTFIISLLLVFSHIFAIPDSDPCQGASYCEVTQQSRSLNSIPGAQVLPVSPFAASFGKERHHSPPPSPTSWRPTAPRTSSKLNRILAKHPV